MIATFEWEPWVLPAFAWCVTIYYAVSILAAVWRWVRRR